MNGNESLVYKKRLDSASKTRLRNFRINLGKDVDLGIFDRPLLDLVLQYAYHPKDVLNVKNSLEQLTDEDGHPFTQSYKQYSKLEVQLRKFCEKDYTSFRWNKNYQAALNELKDYMSRAQLQPLQYRNDDDILHNLPKVDTHSGFTYILTGNKRKGDNMEGIHHRFFAELSEAKANGTFAKPILPGVRTQGSAFDDDGNLRDFAKLKTRLVSMVDLSVIICENMYAAPFQRWMGNWNYYAGGKDRPAISRIISGYRAEYEKFVSLDYSSFDQTLSSWLIEDAFEIIFSAFKSFDNDVKQLIVHDFIHKQFIGADRLYDSNKGVPSGSMFTQIVDSLCNILMIKTYFKSAGIRGDMIVMGDDNLLYGDHSLDHTMLCSYLRKNFGVEVNDLKTSYGSNKEDPTFLSTTWKFQGPWRHPHVLLSKMMFPERFRPYMMEGVTPQLILWSYIQTYPAGMSDLMNVEKYLHDYEHLYREPFDVVASRYVPGAFRYIQEYTLVGNNYRRG